MYRKYRPCGEVRAAAIIRTEVATVIKPLLPPEHTTNDQFNPCGIHAHLTSQSQQFRHANLRDEPCNMLLSLYHMVREQTFRDSFA